MTQELIKLYFERNFFTLVIFQSFLCWNCWVNSYEKHWNEQDEIHLNLWEARKSIMNDAHSFAAYFSDFNEVQFTQLKSKYKYAQLINSECSQ